MSKPIGIRPLTQPEVTKLIGKSTFNALHPVRCGCCSNATDFARRVFKVQGVPKAEQNSDSTQGLIAHHLKERHHIESVFFKTLAGGFYVDSAVCGKCGSTLVVFDIDLSNDMLAQLAKLMARPIEQVRIEMETLAERMEENERRAE
jgi:hypothetical protein